MVAPAISFYEDDSTPDDGTVIDAFNPVPFGAVEKGTISDIITIHIWNDKGGDLGSDIATAPRLAAISGVTDMSVIFDGTDINGNVSMLEARSCGAFGTAADQQQDWTPLGPDSMLELGDIPSNCMRVIELRANIPQDADSLTVADFTLIVHV